MVLEHLFGYGPPVMAPIARTTFEDLERIRRSIGMLTVGQMALKREDALARVGRELRRLEEGLRALLDRSG
jgi:hypothetical protein